MINKENECNPQCNPLHSRVTQLIPDTDLVKYWSIIDRMVPGEIMDLTRITEDRRDVFIQCCKMYIDIYHSADFNFNFTKLKKL